jgi:hypothetical protein
MRILQKGTYKGRKFVVGKIVYSEKDILNTEKSFKTALKTLNAIRKNTEFLLYGESSSLEKNIHGKRKVS